jgi:hypothetical protein
VYILRNFSFQRYVVRATVRPPVKKGGGLPQDDAGAIRCKRDKGRRRLPKLNKEAGLFEVMENRAACCTIRNTNTYSVSVDFSILCSINRNEELAHNLHYQTLPPNRA